MQKNLSPVSFAQFVPVNSFAGLSKEAKLYLSQEKIFTFADLSKISREKFEFVYDKKLKLEIQNFYDQIIQFLKKESVLVKYTRNFPCPVFRLSKERWKILVAFIMFQRFFGNRKNMQLVKEVYLGDVYKSTNDRREKQKRARVKLFSAQRKFKFAS